MRFPKVKFKKIKKIPKNLVEKGILVLILIFLFDFAFFSFFWLSLKSQVEGKPREVEKKLELDRKSYEKILKIWQEREKKFQEIDFKTYSNPFERLTE